MNLNRKISNKLVISFIAVGISFHHINNVVNPAVGLIGIITIQIVEINPNYQMYWSTILQSTSHETYPGHHTEFVLKENRLFHELNQFEHSILILHSPKLIISEGIANKAISILFSNQEVAEIALDEFCLDLLKEVSLEELELQNKVKAKIPLFWYNFAYHALVDAYDEKELMSYGKNFEIFSNKI